MAVLMVFASLWGVLQLAALGSWSRSVRVSTLALTVGMGCYGCGVLAVLLQVVWTRGLSAVSGSSLSSVVDTAAYTVDPIIEEVVKVLPLLLLGWFARRVSRQLGLTDHLLVGAATGAGFALFEAMLRYGTVSRMASDVNGGYLVRASLAGVVLVPGIPATLTSWLPDPAATVDFLGDGASGVSMHLAWSALVGFGVGWFWRRRDRARFLGLVPLVYAAADHMHYNFDASSHRLSGPAEAAGSVMSWLHGALGSLVIVALVAAVVLDRLALRRVRAAHHAVLLPGEQPTGLSPRPLIHLACTCAPWTTAVAVRFVLARHAALFAADSDPADTRLVVLVAEVADELVRADDGARWARAVATLDLKPVSLRPLVRSWQGVGWLLLLLPPLIYLVIGGFPQTRAVQDLLDGSSWGHTLLLVFAMAGLVWLGWQLLSLLRRAGAVARKPLGEELGRVLIRLGAAAGSIVAGCGLVIASLTTSSGSAKVVSNYHALDALGSLLVAAGLALLLLGFIMFPPFALVALPMGGAVLVSTVTGELILTTAGAALLGSLGIVLSEAAADDGGGSGSSASGRTPREERLDELASDPAHGGEITPASRAEAEAGLGLEEQGAIRGPIRRSTNPGEEFIDANGQTWDVKGFRSDVTGRGRFTVENAMKSIRREIAATENVIVDTRGMSGDDVGALREALHKIPGLAQKVLFWP